MSVDGGVGAALPDYEILGELGRGAMGVVLLARHRSLNRQVAIKQLPPALAADPGVRRRFLDEAQTLAALNHPHVVVVHDFVDRAGHLALIMEQLPGGTVWNRFVTEGLTPAAATGLILSTAAGLQHAHDHGVLHRDVKPENLMLAADGQLKVTDFGIAQVVGGDRTVATSDGRIIGTPAYMAPEQAEGQALGPPADVYACGTMLFEMLSGRLPYQSESAIGLLTQRLERDAPPMGSLVPQLPGGLTAVVDRALVRDPAHRYQTAEAMAVDLAQAAADAWGPEWLDRAGVAVRGAETIERAARTTRRPAAAANQATVLPDAPTSHPSVAPPTGSPTVAGGPPTAVPPAPAEQAATAVPQAVVVPALVARYTPPDLSEIDPDQLINVREVRRPPSPVVPLVLTLVLAVATAAVALVGLGDEPSPSGPGVASVALNGATFDDGSIDERLEIDFAQSIEVGGLPAASADATVELRPSVFGIPLGLASAPAAGGSATVDPGYLRWTTAGSVELDVSLVEGAQRTELATGGVVPIQPWWSTAQTVAAALVGLLGLSLLPSNLAGFRRGRPRIGSYVGAAIAGALLGATAAAFGIVALGAPPAIGTIVLAAALSAGFGVGFGETYRRVRRWWLLRSSDRR